MGVQWMVGRRRWVGGEKRRWRSAAATMASLVAASLVATVLVVIAGASPVAAAPLAHTSLITFNMQGEDGGAAAKSTDPVAPYARVADILTLQEVGPTGPSGARVQTPIVTDGVVVRHSWWRLNSESREDIGLRFVYFAQTDRDGGQQIHFADLNSDGKADSPNIRADTSIIGYFNGGPS